MSEGGIRQERCRAGAFGAILACMAIAFGLTACISSESRESVRVLEDIEAGSAPSALKERTPAPVRRAVSYVIDGRAGVADLYTPGEPAGAYLILAPGFSRAGRNDPRVIDLATSLARARFVVLVPEIPGARDLRVRSSDARPIGDAVRYLVMEDMHDLPIGIAAISYAVGPAIIAALLDDVRGEVDFVVGLGGYYDTLDVITYITTGAYRDSPDEDWSFGDPYPFSKWIFLASNADVLDDATDRADLTEISDRRLADPAAPIDDLTVGLGPEGRSVLAVMTNHDPDRVPALVEALPRPVRAEIAALSLAGRDLTPLAGRLILIHGREDRMVPYTESRDLAAAVGDTELFEVPGFSHIDPKSVGLWGRLILIDAMQEVLSRRRFTGHAQDAGG